MKKYIIIIGITICAYLANAQRVVEKQIEVKSTCSLTLDLDFADSIIIKQSNDNSIRVKVMVNINDNLNNDKYELITSEGGQSLRMSAKIHDMESIRVPCRNHHGASYNFDNGKCLSMNIKYEIEIPTITYIKLETISGDVIINKSNCPMSIESISGFIDLSIPYSANSEIKIQTVTGGVYTNHEYDNSSDRCRSNPGGTDANFRLGNGENRIRLSTVSGDIFVRKI